VLAGRVLVHIFFLGKFFSLAVRPAAEWAEPMQRGPGLGVNAISQPPSLPSASGALAPSGAAIMAPSLGATNKRAKSTATAV